MAEQHTDTTYSSDLKEHEKFLENQIFVNDPDRLSRRLELHDRKLRLKEMRDAGPSSPNFPLVVEIAGSPRAGKTSCIESVTDFFKRGGFSVRLLEEPAALINNSVENKQKLANLDKVSFNDLTLNIATESLKKQLLNRCDIIIADRGILDNYIWYDMYHRSGLIDDSKYHHYIEEQLPQIDISFDHLIALYCDPREAVRREFSNCISIEPRSKTNLEKINDYNVSMQTMLPHFRQIASDVSFIDTTSLLPVDCSFEVADKIMDSYEEKVKVLASEYQAYSLQRKA